MNNGVQLTIPQQLYDRAWRVALSQQKDVSDVVVEVLDLGLPEVAEDSEREREKAAYLRLHPTLLEKYAGEYVAIHGDKLVDHDVNRVALLGRIEVNYPDVFVLVRPVQSEPEIVYRHVSLRLG